MNREVTVERVEAHETRSGNTRWVLRDSDGNEYTTFKPDIGARAREAEGRRARIEYHETQRGNWTNVYLDAVEPLDEPAADDADDRAVDETRGAPPSRPRPGCSARSRPTARLRPRSCSTG